MRDSYTRVSTEVNPSSASHLFPLGTFSPTVKVVQHKPHPPPKNTPPIGFDSIRFECGFSSSSSSTRSSPLVDVGKVLETNNNTTNKNQK